jgi:hypothetical protein
MYLNLNLLKRIISIKIINNDDNDNNNNNNINNVKLNYI